MLSLRRSLAATDATEAAHEREHVMFPPTDVNSLPHTTHALPIFIVAAVAAVAAACIASATASTALGTTSLLNGSVVIDDANNGEASSLVVQSVRVEVIVVVVVGTGVDVVFVSFVATLPGIAAARVCAHAAAAASMQRAEQKKMAPNSPQCAALHCMHTARSVARRDSTAARRADTCVVFSFSVVRVLAFARALSCAGLHAAQRRRRSHSAPQSMHLRCIESGGFFVADFFVFVVVSLFVLVFAAVVVAATNWRRAVLPRRLGGINDEDDEDIDAFTSRTQRRRIPSIFV
jgi:hypothetical protein